MNLDSSDAVFVSDLTVKFGDFIAVNNISFRVKKGEIFGFLGANGAGKTTAIRVICGLLRPNSGTVAVGGEFFKGDGDNLKSKVGYMSQKFTLYDDLTIGENLDFTASIRKLDNSFYQERKKYLLNFINFKYSENNYVKELSGGIKQQVALVASLLHDPDVIFLDEPTAGVTPSSRALFWSLIKKIAEQKKTVFVTSHYMDEVEHCHRIALMRSGEIIALDTPLNLKKENFPFGIIQLTPQMDNIEEEMRQLKERADIESIQPHGIHYHLAPKNEDTLDQIVNAMGNKFVISRIDASLEDVFIKQVEGQNR